MPAIALPRTRQPRLATLDPDRPGRRLPSWRNFPAAFKAQTHAVFHDPARPSAVTLSVAMPAAAAAQDPP